METRVECIVSLPGEHRANYEYTSNALSHTLSRKFDSVTRALVELADEQRRIASGVQSLRVDVGRILPNVRHPFIALGDGLRTEAPEDSGAIIGLPQSPTPYRGRYQPRCQCTCHRGYLSSSPECLQSLLGRPVVGYTGYPRFSANCESANCSSKMGLRCRSATSFLPGSWPGNLLYLDSCDYP